MRTHVDAALRAPRPMAGYHTLALKKAGYLSCLFLFFLPIMAMLAGCSDDKSKLFTRLSESATGVDFRNLLKETEPGLNIMNYPYFYNGGGVAVGDINNDGLADICFTGNMVKNRLYLNKGNFHFEDITVSSGIAAKEGWCTGVTMADVNGDGWLDIYICRSGLADMNYRRNLLFINQHDGHFMEEAAAYGLDDPGYSTQASFFDYDKDGDLDLMLINQSQPTYSQGLQEQSQYRSRQADPILGNKLFRNDGGHFTNVTDAAGIHSNVLTYSLGLSTADIDQDGWPDIYIANDFNEEDYCYINNHDGTFTEHLRDKIDHVSQYSMGCDVADYNNDGLPDICVLDMLPEGNHEQKMHIGADNVDKYNMLFRQGLYYQYMKNSLQRNNGDGTFSEIGQLAGISATDWSWSPLFADLDNDGKKDLFVSNGYLRDNTNLQFLKYTMEEMRRMQGGGEAVRVEDYVSHMSGIRPGSYLFRNAGSDRFEKVSTAWGIDMATYSNGAVYVDLDNDGDLDLVTNDVGDYAGVYRNNGESLFKQHFLRIRLQGTAGNSWGYGAKVYAYGGGQTFYVEQSPVRGYQSSVDPVLHIGLGAIGRLDSLRVIWPDDRTQVLRGVAADQLLSLSIGTADAKYVYGRKQGPVMLTDGGTLGFKDSILEQNDFARQHLLTHLYSHGGPCMAKGDIDGDGLEDVYVGGGSGALFRQTTAHAFEPVRGFMQAPGGFVTDAVFFDADKDGDPDLYLVSGGYGNTLLSDHLYLNDGKGHFTESRNALPVRLVSKSCARAADIDGDGDMDLFVGGREVPGNYPAAEPSAIYINDGHGKFTDESAKWGLHVQGIVTDAAWVDVNQDGIEDLVIVGEWMPVTVLLNDRTHLVAADAGFAGGETHGWWNKVVAADLNGDGRKDLVLGNYGWNSPLTATSREPVRLYSSDIDKNGIIDPILTAYNQHVDYPFMPMDDITRQVPVLKKKFYAYETYANATVQDLLDTSTVRPLRVTSFTSCWLENTGHGLVMHELPVEAQYAPVYAIAVTDMNGDGHPDLVLGGNQVHNRIRLGRDDASHGQVFLNDGQGNFRYVVPVRSGLTVRGEIRSMAVAGKRLLIGVNGQPVKTYIIQ